MKFAVSEPAEYVTVPGTDTPLDVICKVIDEPIVAASIGSLNVTVIPVFTGTPAAPFTGLIDATVGGTSSRVANENEKSDASPLPAASFAPVVTVAVNDVAFGSDADGVTTAVRVAEVYVTAPGSVVPPDVFNTNVVALTVVGSIASLNVALIVDDRATAVAPLTGFVDVTVGAVTSGIVIADVVLSTDCSDVNPTPTAATRYLYVVPSLSPLSVKLVVTDSPIFTPSR
jgi:hypothetical protein